MNAIEMMDNLKAELELIFKSFRFKPEDMESGIKFFVQDLPAPVSDEDDENMPYQRIKLINVKQESDERTASVIILICCQDSTPDQQGWRDVQNQIDKILLRFGKNKIFGEKYEVKSIYGMLNDENTFPISLGGLELTIGLSEIVEEEDEFI